MTPDIGKAWFRRDAAVMWAAISDLRVMNPSKVFDPELRPRSVN